VSTTKIEKEVLSTLSQHVLALEPTTNMTMLPTQNPIKELAFSFVQILNATPHGGNPKLERHACLKN
jgi:hypothetical protein